MSKRKISIVVVCFIASIILWNFPVTYRAGINGTVKEIKTPLYAKFCGFLYRDCTYREIVRDILGSERDDEKKALLILQWVNKNMKSSIPDGMRLVDDHPLNIIIRQYGAKEQVEDIFTILCSYAGLKSAYKLCNSPDRSRHMVLSLVHADSRWLIFNASRNKYFVNRQGKVASIDDYLSGNILLSVEEDKYYKGCLEDLKGFNPGSCTRGEEQMPLKRPFVLMRRLFNK